MLNKHQSEGPGSGSGYQKLTSLCHTMQVIATPNCYRYSNYRGTLVCWLINKSILVEHNFSVLFQHFLNTCYCGVKWPSILLGGTFEKDQTKFSMHKNEGVCWFPFTRQRSVMVRLLTDKDTNHSQVMPGSDSVQEPGRGVIFVFFLYGGIPRWSGACLA